MINGSRHPVKLLILAGAILLTALAIVIYARLDPAESIFFPRCPFHLLTGLYCPGCGSQRAIHHLLNGEVLKAVSYNALAVAAIPYVLLWAILRIMPERCRYAVTLRERLYGAGAAKLITGIVLVFWILRNIFHCISPGLWL